MIPVLSVGFNSNVPSRTPPPTAIGDTAPPLIAVCIAYLPQRL